MDEDEFVGYPPTPGERPAAPTPPPQAQRPEVSRRHEPQPTATPTNTMIVSTRCARTMRDFGVRWVWQPAGHWLATGVVARGAQSQQQEARLTGAFVFAHDYPGCPDCGATGVFTCGRCGAPACWDNSVTVICPWCRQSTQITGPLGGFVGGSELR